MSFFAHYWHPIPISNNDYGYFQTLPHLTNGVWLSLLRNPVIAMDETFQEIFPSLLEIAKAKLYKVHVFECAYNHIIVHHIIAFN